MLARGPRLGRSERERHLLVGAFAGERLIAAARALLHVAPNVVTLAGPYRAVVALFIRLAAHPPVGGLAT